MAINSIILAVNVLASCIAASPRAAASADATLIGALGKDGQVTIHTGIAEPAVEDPSSNTTTLEKRDWFYCSDMGRNPDGRDCTEIYNEIRNIPHQVWRLHPQTYLEFNYVSCRFRVQNRDTCVSIDVHGSALAPRVNSMLQCPYHWRESGLLSLDNPPVLLIMTGQGDDLPPYSPDPRCNPSANEL